MAASPRVEKYLADRRRLVNAALDDLLPAEHNEPTILHRAMRYAVFAGGKRLRPILAIAAAETVGGDSGSVLPLAVAIESVHTYSLVHDDLPAMDDDDLRRGKPTAHKVFGEAIAILAGDALLTFAFGLLTSPRTMRMFRLEHVLAVVHELALASGSERLIAGQVLDISSEAKRVDSETVGQIMSLKTAALIRASVTCGARLGGGNEDQIRSLVNYGECLGRAFQIKDDLLDLDGDPAKLGKAVKKDSSRGKATYPRLFGKARAKDMMHELIQEAVRSVAPLGDQARMLGEIAKYVGDRVS